MRHKQEVVDIMVTIIPTWSSTETPDVLKHSSFWKSVRLMERRCISSLFTELLLITIADTFGRKHENNYLYLFFFAYLCNLGIMNRECDQLNRGGCSAFASIGHQTSHWVCIIYLVIRRSKLYLLHSARCNRGSKRWCNSPENKRNI